MWLVLQGSRYGIHRIVKSPSKSRQPIDLSKPILYRMASGRNIWLPSIIEEADTCTGYLAKGKPKKGDIAVDVGAFCGETTIELAILVGPSGHVYALEPDPHNRALLQRNLELHNLKNVTILPHVLWSHTTELVFAAAENAASSIESIRIEDSSPSEPITVSALSPRDLFARIGRMPDFMKMDIEGAEVEVLSALTPILADSQESMRLAIASYHIREGKNTHELITPALSAIGYQVETGYPEHTTTWAWKA